MSVIVSPIRFDSVNTRLQSNGTWIDTMVNELLIEPATAMEGISLIIPVRSLSMLTINPSNASIVYFHEKRQSKCIANPSNKEDFRENSENPRRNTLWAIWKEPRRTRRLRRARRYFYFHRSFVRICCFFVTQRSTGGRIPNFVFLLGERVPPMCVFHCGCCCWCCCCFCCSLFFGVIPLKAAEISLSWCVILSVEVGVADRPARLPSPFLCCVAERKRSKNPIIFKRIQDRNERAN